MSLWGILTSSRLERRNPRNPSLVPKTLLLTDFATAGPASFKR